MKRQKKIKEKKAKKSEEKKETKLEEEIIKIEKQIKEEDFFEEPVRQLPISAESSAPVLERIIQREIPTPIVEQQAERETAGNESRINYTSANEPQYGFQRNTANDEEKKYETNFVPPVLSRREFSADMKREFLKSPEQAWGSKADEQGLEEINFMEEKRRLPFEEQQKKYRRAKLR